MEFINDVVVALFAMLMVMLVIFAVQIHRYEIMFQGYGNLVLNANYCSQKYELNK